MTENDAAPSQNQNPNPQAQRKKYRFAGMIASVILVSCVLTGISLQIYNASGAAQVDLSRPGYQSVRKEASADRSTEQFSSTGELSPEVFAQFDSMYERHAKRTVDATSFGEEALSDDSLQIFADTNASSAAASVEVPESQPAQ